MTSNGPMRRVALLLEYRGTEYAGFQVQPGQRTVQGTLEAALAQLCQEPIRVVGASRTDAGVHALGQVVAFSTTKSLSPMNLVRGLNYHLPKDIAARDACNVPPNFNPRREALRRTYRYTILLRPSRSALWRDSAYQIAGPVDVSLMSWGAGLIRGQRDWSAFAASLAPTRSPVRQVEDVSLSRCGERLCFSMTANSFLPQQVRRTVGTLLHLGQGKLTAEQFASLVEQGGTGAAAWVVPARGLCLTHIDYGEKLRFLGAEDEDLPG